MNSPISDAARRSALLLTAVGALFASACAQASSPSTQLAEPAQMVVIALSQSTLPFRLQVDLGSRFPILISATGRLFAAFNVKEPDELRREFDKLVWDHPPSYDDWCKEIEQTRTQGYAVDRGTYISGVTVVAVPVFNAAGRMTRSLVAIGISERLGDAEVPRLAKALLDLADRFGRPATDGVLVAHELTQEELAQLVGASRETVNKALAEFVQRGWLRLEARAVVILDMQRLRQRSR
mgnify:CR=1 FL=1